MIFSYLIKSSLSLVFFYLFYHFLISRENRPVQKRFYLLFALLFSCFIPFISINNELLAPISLEQNFPAMIDISNQPDFVSSEAIQTIKKPTNTLIAIISVTYLTVILFMSLRFFSNLFSIAKKQSKSEVIDYEGYKVVLLDKATNPYSFLNSIYVSKNDYLNMQLDVALLQHEMEHIRQKHSFDLILVEILQIIFWFNPLLILYKRAIRLNHEFQVDRSIVNKSCDPIKYQELLLQAATKNRYRQFQMGFDSSFIKSRILMLNAPAKGIYFSVKLIFIVLIMGLFSVSLVVSQNFQGNILSHPYFIEMTYPDIYGKWTGKGKLYQHDLHQKIGFLNVELEIDENLHISGKIGDASISSGQIAVAKYGLEIQGMLEGRINQNKSFRKKYITILLGIPEIKTHSLDVNFHLSNNLKWDSHMQVGGLILNKTD